MDKLVVPIALKYVNSYCVASLCYKKNKDVVITTMWKFQGLACNEQVFTKNTYVFISLLIYIHH
jgi:hypothetical protein